MGINLLKLAEDLTHPDEDIRLLAMRTLCRLDMASTTLSNLQLLQRIKQDLEERMAHESGDAQFFAQKAYEHLKPSFGLEAPATAPAKPAAPPREPAREREAAPGPPAPPKPVPPPSPLRTRDAEALVKSLKALCQQPDPSVYADLLDVLARATDPRVIGYALPALAAIGSATDLPTVQAFFTHAMPEIRANAVAAYSRLAPGAALLPGLAPMLTDPDPRVSANVLAAIAKADREQLVRLLEQMLSANQLPPRIAAVMALAGLSGDQPVELLRKAARDANAQVRAKVVQALEYQSHPQVPDLLARLSQDPDPAIAQAAARAAARRRPPQPPAARTPPAAPRAAPPGPAASQAEVSPLVLRLQQIETERLTAARPEVLEALEGEKEPIVVSAALSALSVIGTSEELGLVRRFLGHKNDRVRANAVEAVERLGSSEQVLTLLAPLANDRDNRVRGNTLKALGRYDPQSVLPHVEYLLSSADVETRTTGLFVLATLDSVDTTEFFTRIVVDDDAGLRKRAVAALAGRPGTESLLERLAGDSDRGVVAAAKAALSARMPLPAPAARPAPGRGERLPPTRAVETPDLPPLRTAARAATSGDSSPAVSTGALDFGKFDPDRDSAEPPAPGAFGREMDADMRENAPSRLMLAPEMQDVLDGLYDQLDRELEQMGRRIWKLIRANLINDVKLVANSRAVQKAEGVLEAHLAEVNRMGLLKSLFSKRETEHKRAQIDFQTAEAYRKLGELAVEQLQAGGKRHADLAEMYAKVEEIFTSVRKLKEGKA
ncbi:MAG: HEAT repeat domain-containing protein [Candidatus Wallbacteria bacterium]|nr:HEAT repeat domain-containing protein [Candidatus Wallbacteria bacterium]